MGESGARENRGIDGLLFPPGDIRHRERELDVYSSAAFDELMRLADKVFNVGRDSLPRFKLRNFRDPSDRSFLLVFVQEANFLFEKSTIGREFGN